MLRKCNSIYSSLQLGKKVTILLLLAFLSGILLIGIALNQIILTQAENRITSEASGILQTITSVRQYNNTQIMPELSGRFETEYLPQTIPTYAVKEVVKNLRQNQGYESYFYKDATLNPTNPEDQADYFETELIRRFRQKNDLEQLTGYIDDILGNKKFYIARPFAVTQPSCLRCHSKPEIAPKTIIEYYGASNGFGWELNQIVATQVIYVPASQVFQQARQSFIIVMVIVLAIFAMAIFLVNLWLKHSVIQPLNRLTKVAQLVSQGEMSAEFEQTNPDEIGSLAEAFSLMKTSLAIALSKLSQFRRHSGSN